MQGSNFCAWGTITFCRNHNLIFCKTFQLPACYVTFPDLLFCNLSDIKIHTHVSLCQRAHMFLWCVQWRNSETNTLHDAITEMSHKWHAIIKVSVCMCVWLHGRICSNIFWLVPHAKLLCCVANNKAHKEAREGRQTVKNEGMEKIYIMGKQQEDIC